MYSDIPFWLSIVFLFGGLGVLAWSSDVFLIGAGIAVPVVRAWEELSIAIPIGLLLVSTILMFFRSSR